MAVEGLGSFSHLVTNFEALGHHLTYYFLYYYKIQVFIIIKKNKKVHVKISSQI